MKKREEDVESAAQLLSKESGQPNEEFDLEDAEEPHRNWSPRYDSHPSPLRRRRTQSVSLPANWLSSRKVNPRYIIFAVVVSLVVTVLIFNPYNPSKASQSQSSEAETYISPTSTSPSDYSFLSSSTPLQATSPTSPTASTISTTTNSATPTGAAPIQVQSSKENYTAYERPQAVYNGNFCSTWPVGENGEYDLKASKHDNHVKLDSIAPKGGWKKPDGLKVIAMVFFGRKRYVDILDCYLQKNLASNGGYLDEVWFMAHTQDPDDMAWVEGLVLENPSYKIVGQGVCEDKKYRCLWQFATQDKTIYIKIDDDIIFIHPDTIPQLVHTRIAVPHPFAISANLVNSPITGMEAYHHGAVHPFVPDPSDKPKGYAREAWRPSKFAPYPHEDFQKLKTKTNHDVIYMNSSYRGHPFLLVSDDHYDLLHTPMGRYDQAPGGDPIAFSPMWKSWAIAAQQQYSLLLNLERNEVSRYFFGRPATYPADAKGPAPETVVGVTSGKKNQKPTVGGEQIFDTQFRRYNLNFCAVWGGDIRAQLPIAEDDEDDITHLIPKRTGRPFVIDTRAVVAHFSFFTQADGIRATDLLDRWRAFANEAVCAKTNRKRPWDLRCPGFAVEGALGS